MTAINLPENTVYLDTSEGVERFLESIAGTRAIALDTEGASFHRFVDRVYLLQLATRDRSAIIDPLAVRSLGNLGRFLEDGSVEVVFHDADYDLRLLHQDYGWHVTNIFDTRIAAQLLGIKSFGLASLLEQYFGVRLDKKYQRADWSLRPLTLGMLEYAAQDTAHLLELRDHLKSELEAKGRWEWAREEFQRLEGTRWESDVDADEAFLRIKGARDLTRRDLALLRELVRWRDSEAREMDRATFRVVGNEVLLETARRAPTSVSELQSFKGMPRALVERKGGAILAAVCRGLAVSEQDLPRFPKAPRWDRDPDFEPGVNSLRAVREVAAQRLGIDPGVLCSRERLEAIARRNPSTLEQLSEIAGVRRWQVRELGEALVGALRRK